VVDKVFISMGSQREEVDEISAGNLFALSGLEGVKPGETIVDAEYKAVVVPFDRARYFSERVVKVAVEPKNPKEMSKLLSALNQLSTEDPNLFVELSSNTGEYLLSGMGELHLEITMKNLRKLIDSSISVSAPRVVYREKITKKGIVATSIDPSGRYKFTLQVEPLNEGWSELQEQDFFKAKNSKDAIAVDEYKNVLMNCTGKLADVQKILDSLVSGFTFACRAGPLCSEPMIGVKVKLMEVQLGGNKDPWNPLEIRRGVGKAIFGSFLTAKPILLEPVYETVISSSMEFAGECLRIVNRKRGKISDFEQKQTLGLIRSHIPVAETFGLSEELRSATSGHAVWQSTFSDWKKLPGKLEAKIIAKIRERKGLPSDIPQAQRFLDGTL
jgi:elongation factor 2